MEQNRARDWERQGEGGLEGNPVTDLEAEELVLVFCNTGRVTIG